MGTYLGATPASPSAGASGASTGQAAGSSPLGQSPWTARPRRQRGPWDQQNGQQGQQPPTANGGQTARPSFQQMQSQGQARPNPSDPQAASQSGAAQPSQSTSAYSLPLAGTPNTGGQTMAPPEQAPWQPPANPAMGGLQGWTPGQVPFVQQVQQASQPTTTAPTGTSVPTGTSPVTGTSAVTGTNVPATEGVQGTGPGTIITESSGGLVPTNGIPVPGAGTQTSPSGLVTVTPQSYTPSVGTPGISDALTSQVTNALNTGSRYNLPQVQQVQQALTAQLQQQYGAQQKQLDEEMARRGIGASSIASGYYGDLAGQQATAMANMNANLIQNQAQTAAQDTATALGAGQNLYNTQAQTGLGYSQLGLQGTLGLGSLGLGQSQLGTQNNQFNANLSQQNSLANLSNATANRGIDAQQSTANNQFMSQLLATLGLPQQSTFLTQLANQMGVQVPTTPQTPANTTPPVTQTTGGGGATTGNTGTSTGGGTGNGSPANDGITGVNSTPATTVAGTGISTPTTTTPPVTVNTNPPVLTGGGNTSNTGDAPPPPPNLATQVGTALNGGTSTTHPTTTPTTPITTTTPTTSTGDTNLASQVSTALNGGGNVGPGQNASQWASWIDPTTGQTKNTPSTQVPAGVSWQPSAQLNSGGGINGGSSTAQGTTANPMAGYVTPQGGSYAGWTPWGTQGVPTNPQAYGLPANATPQQAAQVAQWASAMNNGDPRAEYAALNQSDNPWLQQQALAKVVNQLTMNDTQGTGIQLVQNLPSAMQNTIKQAFMASGATQGTYNQATGRYDGPPSTAAYQNAWTRMFGGQ